jgi:Fe-S cluster biogenesis protein NfuA
MTHNADVFGIQARSSWLRSLVLASALLGACAKDQFVRVGDQRGRVPSLSDAGAAGVAAADNPHQAEVMTSAGTQATPAGTPSAAATRVVIDQTGSDNPAGLPKAEVNKLIAGGPLDKLRWLYPYDGTVFPGGSLAPTLMWEGDPASDAVYLHVHSIAFEYKAVLKPTTAQGSATPLGVVVSNTAPLQPQLQIPQSIWDAACDKTQGKSDPFTMELTTRVAGVVTGPITSHFSIAPGAVRGSVYYTSYYSKQLGQDTGYSAALMRIPPRGKNEVVQAKVDGACAGCHSVSANGSRMIALTLKSGAPPTKGFSFQLDPMTGVTDRRSVSGGNSGLVALYPDGSKYLAQAQGKILGHWALYTAADALYGTVTTDATLYDATSAAVIPATGIPVGALMPSFSPDGTRLVFNDYAIGEAHGLATMDYDVARDKASGYKLLKQEDSAGALRPGWPCFLPDNHAVVFVRTDSPDFGGSSNDGLTAAATDPSMTRTAPAAAAVSSDLYFVDVASGQASILARAMGFDTASDFASEKTYLPFGASDVHRNFNTTVSPVAAGGYFWVFFDSLRNYGNLGLQRAIWGTAIDIQPNGTYASDPSHPAFYLAGQEFGSDNHRAFSARDLCRAEGQPCATGIDCCTGFCSATSSNSVGSCTPPKHGCANRDEHCTSAADCCDSNDYCINNFCAFVPLL